MSLTSISVIMTVFVLNLHHRGPNTQEIPLWIKHIFLDKISTLFCLKREPRYAHCYTDESKFIRNLSVKLTLDNISQELQNEIQMENGVESVVVDTQGNTVQERRDYNFHSGQNEGNRKQNTTKAHPHPTTNEEILQSLKKILVKHEREDRDYEIIQEWRRFAEIVDRILFWIFLVGTLMSTIAVLVIAPASR